MPLLDDLYSLIKTDIPTAPESEQRNIWDISMVTSEACMRRSLPTSSPSTLNKRDLVAERQVSFAKGIHDGEFVGRYQAQNSMDLELYADIEEEEALSLIRAYRKGFNEGFKKRKLKKLLLNEQK
jgi:hypothetical protein